MKDKRSLAHSMGVIPRPVQLPKPKHPAIGKPRVVEPLKPTPAKPRALQPPKPMPSIAGRMGSIGPRSAPPKRSRPR